MEHCIVCGYETPKEGSVAVHSASRSFKLWRLVVTWMGRPYYLCSPDCYAEYNATAIISAIESATGEESTEDEEEGPVPGVTECVHCGEPMEAGWCDECDGERADE